MAVGLGLLLGGAAGNLTDRVFRHNHGAVIDFIDAARIGSRDWWPVFNVADAAIVVGVVILVLSYRRRPGRHRSADATPIRMADDWELPGALDGERLDRALALLTGCSRRQVDELIDGGRVRVDDG